MKAVAVIVLLTVTISACSEHTTAIVETDNPSFTVRKLFTVNGCTVYRFSDGGRAHFVDCRGSVSTTEQYICGHTGKNNQPVYCYRENLVETEK